MTTELDRSQQAHLSDDALDDVLLEAGNKSAVAHLAVCEFCSGRLETFRTSMANFNQASSAWAEAKSNSIPRELSPRWSFFSVLPAWSVAAAFFFAVALSFLIGIHRGMTPHEAPVESARILDGQGVDRDGEIASDNAMLHAIDSAISQPVPSPVEVYGMERATAVVQRRDAPHEVRD